MYTKTIAVKDYLKVYVYDGYKLIEIYKQYQCGCQECGIVLSGDAIAWGETKKRCPIHGQEV